ncbi:hypothetical protein GGR88_002720 [Sphingomonas jejuensis]|uniref:Uncharacterized protein n=1 Tax=Sphingomonas jejuensis TaxID=904715 RepID=A0ABX0XRC0_9SPHN|nr:hypothetical protein [Sphingomonas jejuensis]NJC35206.1 hypothetical protein [Sphingomonas jejuensis]
MSAGGLMLLVAVIAGIGGAVLLLRLRGPLSPPARTAHLMAGTMAAALALVLAIYSTALG